MTDAPRRTISGLTPRTTAQPGGVERLLKKNRPQASEAPDNVEPVAPTPEPAPSTAPTARSSKKARPAPAVEVPTEEPKESMSVRVRTSIRARSRAAYRATSAFEGDESYSDMIEKAIEAEVRRRELAHNDGKPFAANTASLPAGRPLGG